MLRGVNPSSYIWAGKLFVGENFPFLRCLSCFETRHTTMSQIQSVSQTWLSYFANGIWFMLACKHLRIPMPANQTKSPKNETRRHNNCFAHLFYVQGMLAVSVFAGRYRVYKGIRGPATSLSGQRSEGQLGISANVLTESLRTSPSIIKNAVDVLTLLLGSRLSKLITEATVCHKTQLLNWPLLGKLRP